MGRVREVVCGVIGVALLGSMSIAHADWRVFSDAAGAASIRSLDTTLSVGLVLDCTRDVTLVTQDAFPPGNSGLSGTYDNGLKFVVEARVPQQEPHTVSLARSDQRDAFIRGLTNRHHLTLVDPNGRSHTFELAGFGALWRATCSSTG